MKKTRRVLPVFLALILSVLLVGAAFFAYSFFKASDKDKVETHFCTLSVRCDNALGKTEEKAEILPEDGVILPEMRVSFSEGESVFDILYRTLREKKIHMEFSETPLYGTAYIEGIANLYEFDCGAQSGWMYKVNGIFPNYGCSAYQLKDGDRVEWVYTCDLGKDVGGEYVTGENGDE